MPRLETTQYWAKTNPYQSVVTHGLVSGHVAQILCDEYLSAGTVRILTSAFGIEEHQLKAIIGFLVSIHDIGKIEYSFQAKDTTTKGELDIDPVDANRIFNVNVRHEKTGCSFIRDMWKQAGENSRTTELFSKIIGAHHPGREGDDGYKSKDTWNEARRKYEMFMRDSFLKDNLYTIPEISKDSKGIIGALLLAITIISDWIASGPAFQDAEEWINDANAEETICAKAHDFLNIGELKPVTVEWPNEFSKVWPNIPDSGKRPLQVETENLFFEGNDPYSLVLLEAPMGEGKTEAGIYAALQLAKSWKKDGLYLALPTSATSNQMVGRFRKLLNMHNLTSHVRLLHAMAWLERLDAVNSSQEESDGIANWLAPVRRGLLGQYAVGTVDQAMLAATTVKYGALRLLGLSNKVLLIDEIHSYDAYMNEIIKRLLEWCKALEIPVVMLSATLPPEKKKDLFSPFTTAELSTEYPLITAIKLDGTISERRIKSTTHQLTAQLSVLPELTSSKKIAETAVSLVKGGGCLCVLMNTVKEAQDVYSEIKKQYNSDLLLFHAQFTAQRREEIESECIRRYGKDKTKRPKQSILVATQVVEQSLDVDFDAMITAIAPIDLLLQRLGRVHRHEETDRPDSFKQAFFEVLTPKDSSFGASAYVYPECILKSSIRVLKGRKIIRLPGDISQMVIDGYDARNVPEEELQEWMENQVKDLVKSGASQQFLVNEPSKQYNALIEDSIFGDDTEYVTAKTRLGEPTLRIAMLEPVLYDALMPYKQTSNDETTIEVWNRDIAEKVLLQTVSISAARFKKECADIKYVRGGKLLSGVLIVKMKNRKHLMANGKALCNDMELGVIIKEGEL